MWQLDGTVCGGEICHISGQNSESNRVDLRALGREKEAYLLRCYVEMNGEVYSQEWSIHLLFEGLLFLFVTNL